MCAMPTSYIGMGPLPDCSAVDTAPWQQPGKTADDAPPTKETPPWLLRLIRE